MTKKFSILSEYFIFALLLSFSVYISLFGNFSAAVSDGISLWATVVLPSLFPYFFITATLSSLKVTGKISARVSPITKKIFNVGGACGYALFISLLSGYPIGAKTVCDLKEKGVIGESESVRAAALCSTSSPMFLLA